MKKQAKKIAAIFLALFASALLSAAPERVDWKGQEIGLGIPEWFTAFERLVPGKNQSGKIEWSKRSKKLYRALGLKDGDILFYSVTQSDDKDRALAQSSLEARLAALASAREEARKLPNENGSAAPIKGGGEVIPGLSRAADFWLEESGQGGPAFTACQLLKISSARLQKAAGQIAARTEQGAER